MHVEEVVKKDNSLLMAQYHAWFHHNDSDGWITVAKKTKNNLFKQYHYEPKDLAKEISNWIGEDVYFSQNTFYKPQRSIHNLRNLKALYTDVDFYLLNYDPSWVLGKLEYEFFGKLIPDPNMVIFSGRGLVLIWLLEPVPYKALPLWQAVQNYFFDQLKDLGGDAKSKDAARVFRIAGSTNSKSGEEVYVEYRHDYRYELRQLQFDFLPDLNEVVNPPKQKKKGRKKKVVHLFNVYRLHYARMLDLVKLVELRNYEVTGYRELICFLYRYWSCCYMDDPTEALNQTSLLNSEFKEPLQENELIRATKSAEKAWKARNNEEANRIAQEQGYPAAGYNLKNEKIIDWLGITFEEQRHLKTIIDSNEKRRRKRERDKLAKRIERNSVSREEYNKDQQTKKNDKLKRVQELLNKGLKQVQIADELGISKGYVSKLVREIK